MLLLSCRDHMLSHKEFNIVKCPGCSLVYTNPRPSPSNLGAYYESGEYISHTESRKGLKEKLYHLVRREMLRRKKNLINNIKPGKKFILDVGCGAGEFLKTMQDTGNEVIGYEPAPVPRQKATNKGLKVLGEERELKNIGNPDVITLWHVLEHMPDFMDRLKEFNKMLAPGGFLILAVPLWQSYDAYFYGEHWAAWDVPRHLFHFDNDSLLRVCKDAGFTFHQSNALPFDAYYVSLLSEQYKGNPLGPLRAMVIGTISGLLAIAGRRPWSSQVFVFRKS